MPSDRKALVEQARVLVTDLRNEATCDENEAGFAFAMLRAAADMIERLAALQDDRKAEPLSGAEPVAWRTLIDAPLDGTEVELFVRHVNWRYANGDERDEWQQVVRGHWIDFNSGGWTWHGIAGDVLAWRPILATPVAPIEERKT